LIDGLVGNRGDGRKRRADVKMRRTFRRAAGSGTLILTVVVLDAMVSVIAVTSTLAAVPLTVVVGATAR